MVFSKTNEKHSISSKVCFMKLMLTENFFVQDTFILQSCTKKKSKKTNALLTYANFKATFPLLYYFYEKKHCYRFFWHTFKHTVCGHRVTEPCNFRNK